MDRSISRYLPTRRRLIQLYAALLYNAHARGWIQGGIYTGGLKQLCVPGFNCYSCPAAIGACPLGALQNALASSSVRAPSFALGILLLMGLTLGRTVCGFLCPAGLIQELLYKVRTPKVRKSRLTRALSLLKYAVLLVFVVGIPLYYAAQRLPLPAFCKYICPIGTLEGAVGLLANPNNAGQFSMLGFIFQWKVGLLILFLAGSVFLFRPFCRFICPLGAIYSLFSRVALLGVEVQPQRCVNCGKCVRCCKMDVCRVGDRECIQCGECAKHCPTGAIVRRARIPVRKPVGVALAAIVLAAALVTVNAPKASSSVSNVEAVQVGGEVGDLCPDFTVPLYSGGEFSSSQARGKVLVVNFWATWCTPCIRELPLFNQAMRTYPEEIEVVAVHSSLVTEDVPAWIAQSGVNLPYALDEGGVIELFGGGTMLPMTVIVDADGVITYNAIGSVTWDLLNEDIQKAMNASSRNGG
ncbi:MAG: redoxin domain-containing protein [Clostridia bacterium]|nr:redoxin domain-containing protein [Clostridia bacterium]